MSLAELAKELEKEASLRGIDLYIDNTTEGHSFIPVINEKGVVGAIGQYLEKSKIKTGYFVLNENVVKYALNEGFDKDQIFDCFKDKIFSETNKDGFFKLMLASD